MEAIRPGTTGLRTASPGGADVARLPAVAAVFLQGAAVVVAAANPVGIAAELRAQPVVMLAQWVAVVDVAAVAVEAAAAVPAAAVAVAVVAAATAAAVFVDSASRLF